MKFNNWDEVEAFEDDDETWTHMECDQADIDTLAFVALLERCGGYVAIEGSHLSKAYREGYRWRCVDGVNEFKFGGFLGNGAAIDDRT